MSSLFPNPVLVAADGSSFQLSKVPLSGESSLGLYSEDWLQNLLYKHPQALPIAEIDDSFSDLVPICREMETPVGPIDVLFVTRKWRPVIVEAKLWRNPEARRKVVGQILDYAKELARWNFENLDAAVRRVRRMDDGDAPKGLLEVMAIGSETSEAARFIDGVSQSLRRGDFLLLIVGDGIREGVGGIAEFLDGHASLHFTFGLVEMSIFRAPNDSLLVSPRVLAQSTILNRVVIDVRDGAVTVRTEEGGSTADDEEAVDPELIAARERFRTFWQGFLRQLHLDDRSQPMRQAATSQNQFFDMPKGTNAWVSAYVAQSSNGAGVYLSFSKGPIGDRLYQALLDDRIAVEKALGVRVDWSSQGGKHYITTSRNYTGALIADHGEELQRTLADWTNRYISVFRPRLAKLLEESVAQA